jgi:hypothetical protein
MSDEELIALAALVNHETMWMGAVNEERQSHGYAHAYVEPSDNYIKLQKELTRREANHA